MLRFPIMSHHHYCLQPQGEPFGGSKGAHSVAFHPVIRGDSHCMPGPPAPLSHGKPSSPGLPTTSSRFPSSLWGYFLVPLPATVLHPPESRGKKPQGHLTRGGLIRKHLPAMWETWVRSLGQEDALEKEMATHSSILAWRIPWTEEPGGLQSTGCKESDMTERLQYQGCILSPCLFNLYTEFIMRNARLDEA